MSINTIKIGNYSIGETNAPFIIAEMSGNHNQSIERAFKIVDEAAKAGAHAIKLQTYTADTITVKGALQIQDEGSLWKGRELYDLYSEAYTPWEWHKPIFDYAISLGLIAFSSPFDITAVDFLESLDVPAYKIASFENTDHILLKRVAQTGKPVIMSTGVSTISDIDESVQVLRDNGCKDLIILKCTSTYPSTPENTNLRAIPLLKQIYNTQVGLSDHTMGVGVAVASVTFGATVIEKHFTLSRAEGGVDSAFSLEPQELESLVTETKRAFQSLGKPFLGIQEAEKKSIKFKRSLFVVEDIKAGESFSIHNVQSKRPAFGLHTRHFETINGKIAKMDIPKGTPLSWSMID
jgi:pseudaminic acid synthase